MVSLNPSSKLESMEAAQLADPHHPPPTNPPPDIRIPIKVDLISQGARERAL